MSLIAADDLTALGAVIFGLAWLGFWADRHPVARKVSGVPWVLTAALLLSNTGVIPLESPAYDFVGTHLLPLGIPFLLFKADFRTVFTKGGWVLPCFGIACAGISLGAILGFHLFDLGPEGAKIAGTYAGAFIGGASDFVAISQAVNMTPQTFSVSVGASAPAAIVGLMILVSIPSIAFIRRNIPSRIMDEARAAQMQTMEEEFPRLRLDHIAGAIAISFSICAVSLLISRRWGLEHYNLLIVTLITVALANLMPRRMAKLEGDFPLGMLCMYAFFAVIGAGTNSVTFLLQAPVLFVYCTFMLCVHFAVVLIAAKLFKLDLADALMGSAAAIIGAAAAAGVASAKGWRTLVTPAIAVGMFGKVIANFIGIAIVKWLS